METVEINIQRSENYNFDFPVTFICGYKHFLNTGVVTTPKEGIIIYIIKEKHIEAPLLKGIERSDRVLVFPIPDKVSYLRFITDYCRVIAEKVTELPPKAFFRQGCETE